MLSNSGMQANDSRQSEQLALACSYRMYLEASSSTFLLEQQVAEGCVPCLDTARRMLVSGPFVFHKFKKRRQLEFTMPLDCCVLADSWKIVCRPRKERT